MYESRDQLSIGPQGGSLGARQQDAYRRLLDEARKHVDNTLAYDVNLSTWERSPVTGHVTCGLVPTDTPQHYDLRIHGPIPHYRTLPSGSQGLVRDQPTAEASQVLRALVDDTSAPMSLTTRASGPIHVRAVWQPATPIESRFPVIDAEDARVLRMAADLRAWGGGGESFEWHKWEEKRCSTPTEETSFRPAQPDGMVGASEQEVGDVVAKFDGALYSKFVEMARELDHGDGGCCGSVSDPKISYDVRGRFQTAGYGLTDGPQVVANFDATRDMGLWPSAAVYESANVIASLALEQADNVHVRVLPTHRLEGQPPTSDRYADQFR